MKTYGYLSAICLAVLIFAVVPEARSAELGDPAAALNIETWVQGTPVDLASGKGRNVYVVEFWATWCGPCRTSIPHLTDLQQKYNEDNVVFIGVSDETAEIVESYVLNMGTSMGYTVAVDPSRRTHRGYMTAYRQGGIPTAFIVDRDGRVAWVGHPMGGLDAALAQVVKNTYDIDAMRIHMQNLAKAERDIPTYFELVKSGVLSQAKTLGDRIAENGREHASLMNAFAWSLLTDPDLPTRDLELAMKVAKSAYLASDGENASIVDTYARAFYESGNLTRAIIYQRKAVELADNERMRELLAETLETYERIEGQ